MSPEEVYSFWLERSKALDKLFMDVCERLISAQSIIHVFYDQVPEILAGLSQDISDGLRSDTNIGKHKIKLVASASNIYHREVQPKAAMLRSIRNRVAGIRQSMLQHQQRGEETLFDPTKLLQLVIDDVHTYVIPLAHES